MGSWAGAKYSDGTREWDLFSNIQILFDQHIQRIGWQRCLGKAYNLQDLNNPTASIPNGWNNHIIII